METPCLSLSQKNSTASSPKTNKEVKHETKSQISFSKIIMGLETLRANTK